MGSTNYAYAGFAVGQGVFVGACVRLGTWVNVGSDVAVSSVAELQPASAIPNRAC